MVVEWAWCGLAFWDPYLFMQPLKLATLNLVHKLGLGVAYQETTLRTKIDVGQGQGSIQKTWDPLLISLFGCGVVVVWSHHNHSTTKPQPLRTTLNSVEWAWYGCGMGVVWAGLWGRVETYGPPYGRRLSLVGHRMYWPRQ